jgi:serine/threonine protein kinase
MDYYFVYIGFTLDGTVKLLDFGLAKIIENTNVDTDEVYAMSGETGSLRYMAPEVADCLPYNFSADVYSFGIILWELNSMKKPFDGLNRDSFYERIVHGGERPPLNRKWPGDLTSLMSECWDADMHNRPRFRDIVRRLDNLLEKEKGGTMSAKKQFLPKISGMIDRHSTWF